MITVLLVLQIIITVSLVVVILIQKSSSDGMAGLAGGGNSLMSGRASANLLTRITSILATIFIVNSLAMATIAARSSNPNTSIIDDIEVKDKKIEVPLTEGSLSNEETSKEKTPAVPIAE